MWYFAEHGALADGKNTDTADDGHIVRTFHLPNTHLITTMHVVDSLGTSYFDTTSKNDWLKCLKTLFAKKAIF